MGLLWIRHLDFYLSAVLVYKTKKNISANNILSFNTRVKLNQLQLANA